ncbi:MAG: DUF4397 domain-containing protein [Bradyrhizobiaceae bacterium]|nr:DUF4397 domain-containing protein [Bradyrhizobiaceae bacterium]
MKRLIPALAVLLVLVQGCDDNTNNPSSGKSYVRIINMVYDGGALDVRVNGKLVTSGTVFGSSSGYKAADVGRYDVSVHYAGDEKARNSSSQNLAENQTYSVYACPPAAAFAAGFAVDATTITSDKTRLKLVNCTNDQMTKYELWITGSTTRLLGPVDRIQYTGYSDLFAGTYTFSLRKQGDASFSLDFQPIDLLGGTAHSIVLHGTSITTDAYPFGARLFSDNGNGDSYIDLIPAVSSSSMLFVNAASGSSPIAVAIDGTQPQVTNLAYGSATPYLTFGAGTHKYTAAAGTTGLITDRSINVPASEKHSVFVTGTIVPQNIAPIELKDDAQPDASNTMVRFIHISPDMPEVNVITKVGTADYPIPGMQNMTFREVSKSSTTGSNFLKLPPGTYELEFRQPDSTVALYKQTVEFKPNEVMTIWLGGTKQNSTLKVYAIKHD